ncbi:DUF4278 domain-containing protein [Lyngbya confervoides]|uniref:DUF4278 domain-containing protein n=1 Tax=Lyngbya confervoides BDU141951 TaxID=1574623 RepID=A0ABD4T913_9CYAN|nr:DUF4278 domain-containing protein [Lyngbya confervoides]MCM1984973.1 DUF4278 domain-containing protein [Lyngbya confervoides BDU141951]
MELKYRGTPYTRTPYEIELVEMEQQATHLGRGYRMRRPKQPIAPVKLILEGTFLGRKLNTVNYA